MSRVRVELFMVAGYLGFFAAEVAHWSEFELTALVLSISSLSLLLAGNWREFLLYAIGVAAGCGIEIGLGLIFRAQHWTDASLYGVPSWLPLVWGLGFIAIRRFGNLIVNGPQN